MEAGGSNNDNEEVALLFEGGVDGRGAVRAALDAAAARVALVERRRLEGIGQAVPEAPDSGDAASEEGEETKSSSGESSLADEADADVAAELSADAAAGAALRDVPASPSSSSSYSSSSKKLAAGAVVEVVEGVWPCDRLRGGGERAVAPLPRYPAFELLLPPPSSSDKSSRRKDRRRAAAPISANEETPAESEVPAAERARALEAEAAAVREFKARLAFNAGSHAAARAVLGVGGGGGEAEDSSSSPAATVVVAARRSVSRAAVAPRRPEGGWPLLVKPLSSIKGGRRSSKEKPFVALPDGTRRPPSAEERAALRRATPLPRKRGVVS